MNYTKNILLTTVFLGLTLAVSEASASIECPHEDNLLANCGFEVDISSWILSFNSFIAHSTADANTGSGSMEIEMEGLSGQANWSARSECVELEAGLPYRYGGWLRHLSGDTPDLCQTQLHVYEGVNDCSGGSSFYIGSSVSSLTTSFKKSSGTFEASEAGDSAKVHIRCLRGTAGTKVLADDMFLGNSDLLPRESDLGITKDNGVNIVVAGTEVTYTITATNFGPDDASGVNITDTLLPSATWECSGADGGACGAANGTGSIDEDVELPAGGSVTYVVSVMTEPFGEGSLENTAFVNAPIGSVDLNPGNDMATDNDGLQFQADLSVTISNGVDTVVPGEQLTYTIVVTNAGGPSDAEDPHVSSNVVFPTSSLNWTCTGTDGAHCSANGTGNIDDNPILPRSSSVTYMLMVTPGADIISLLAQAHATVNPGLAHDPNIGNNTDADTDTVTPMADLSITKSDGLEIANPGDEVTYTITVHNAGPSDSGITLVEDIFPTAITDISWLCEATGGSNCSASGEGNIEDFVTLLVGDQLVYTATTTFSPNTREYSVLNTASVTPDENDGATDLNTENNSASDRTLSDRLHVDSFEDPDCEGLGLSKTVFLTSQAYGNDLRSQAQTNHPAECGGVTSGLAGANCICQQLASAEGLTGTFWAWLSTSETAPATSFTKSACPYVLVNGATIADNWTDLTDGNLDTCISIDETGFSHTQCFVGIHPDFSVKTNTETTGFSRGGETCLDWTSTSVGISPGPLLGLSHRADGSWTASGVANSHCGELTHQLYCVEQ